MKPKETIHKRITREIQERIRFLKSKIADFNSPITENDYEEGFNSRLTGDKSGEALQGYYDELLQREKELEAIINYDYYFQRQK